MLQARQLIISFIARNKLLVALTFFATILSSLLSVLIPLSIGRFYELVLNDHSVKGRLFDTLGIILQSSETFFVFFILLITAKAVFTLGENFFTGIIPPATVSDESFE